ncbi:unnamed protein product [Cylicostephanus goldi]|uniref:Uncharacterized protein n=1 Tax=Cylicostephanus goldi TaxID=71465 RepID=A0A3P7MIY0_CYLGO|nr:unnamed protein product [Cylicostephanus goldi]
MPPFPDAVLTMERTITVKGPSIEVVSAAEQRISARLRQSYETDLQHRMSFPGIPTMPGMIHPIGDAYAALAASTMRPMGPMCGIGGRADVSKTTRMWVPNSMVGAIIGSKVFISYQTSDGPSCFEREENRNLLIPLENRSDMLG